MDTLASSDNASGRAPADILFYIWKYRIFILALGALGLIAAGVFYQLHPALYRSQAKLFVRYVLERNLIDPVESQSSGGESRTGNTVINSEVEILTSWDLALAAADTVGIERLAGSNDNPHDKVNAASRIQHGLRARSSKGSNVIWLEYTDADRQLAVPVLESVVKLYFDKHLEVHRSIGAFAFVSEQSKQIQARLDETEARLKDLKLRANIVSSAETTNALHTNLVRREAELDAAKAELAAQRARVEQMERDMAGGPATYSPASDAGSLIRYEAITHRIESLQQQLLERLAVFTPESTSVKTLEQQLQALFTQKAEIEALDPVIDQRAARLDQPRKQRADLLAEQTTLSALEARIDTLESQLREVRTQSARFVELAPELAQLERRREAEAANHRYFESSLERARVDEALDPSKIPNISVVQQPSPPRADFGKRDAIAAGLAGGGLIFGCGLAVALGLMFDRTLKRSSEIEDKARLSFLASVPLIRSRSRNGSRDGAASCAVDVLMPGRPARLIQGYCEGIRDRLILGFESSGKLKVPKLIAMTGCVKGAGTSTIAVGLAEALSRTGRGKVLLVNLNMFNSDEPVNGQPALPVDDLLQSRGSVRPVADNLYVATGSSVSTALRRPLTMQIRELFPNLRTSDFDYVIIDLPSTADSSAALTAAGFADKIILIVPAEKVTPEALRRTYHELTSARGDVAVVFNKQRNLVPHWLASDN